MSNSSYIKVPQKCSSEFILSELPTVVILEDDYDTIMPIMREIIEEKLEWRIEFVKNGDEATEKESQFYILDIRLGEGDRQREGMTAAEIIKQKHPSSFVSLFSGIPNLELLRKQARRIGVDYIEEKSENLQVNICRIAIEMINHHKELLRNCKNLLIESGSINEQNSKKIVDCQQKVDNDTEKLWDIIRLEQRYHNHGDLIDDQREKVDYFDENIKVYEKEYKADEKWFKKHEGRYVAFVNGQWLGEAFVANSKDELFKLLDESDDYQDQALFYTCVKNDDILGDNIKSIPRLSSAVQMKNWKF